MPKSKSPAQKISSGIPRALIFSPHPDDECIIGALPLRLLRESKWRIVNIAVTLGSKRERQPARLRELQNACNFLGFDLIATAFEKVNLETRMKNPAQWRWAVKTVSEILAEQKPRAIFLPNKEDVHPAHIGTHFLVLDALKRLPGKFDCLIVETEFWGQMENANLLVESKADDVADLVAALSFHAGEIKRNPYHARLPGWMLDNVRRGAELIGGRGGAAPDFVFGTIYRLQKWRGGKLQQLPGGGFLSAKQNPAKLFC
ncbi:MAG TPA: PIG-L family deacetylase [Verrucomicrobiae bacterium]|nr:PIG-L family deacetylase [Verrucomicrobiae bacterium]